MSYPPFLLIPVTELGTLRSLSAILQKSHLQRATNIVVTSMKSPAEPV